MGSPGPATWSSALADAVRQGDPDGAARAGLAALDANAPLVEIVRAASLAYADSVDVSAGDPLHGLLALASAVRISRHLSPRLQPLPVLRALPLVAREPKLPPSERRRPMKIAGEISHLTRSFEYAVRTGGFGDAVTIFAGLLRDGKERVMAGDILFRLAAEDMGASGHKLLWAVKGWQLASALGWRAGDLLMGPVVSRIATGIEDDATHRTILSVWGREKVDIATIGGNAGGAEGAEGQAIGGALRSRSSEECARGLVQSLKGGVALDAAASVIAREAALRVEGPVARDLAAVHGFLLSDVARWVVRFSKTESRVFPLLQAGVHLRSLPARASASRSIPAATPASLLRDLAGALEAGKAVEAADLALTALSRATPPSALAELLAYEACRGDPTADRGHGLALADAALEEAAVLVPRVPDAIPGLVRAIAAGPREVGGWAPLERRFAPPAISS